MDELSQPALTPESTPPSRIARLALAVALVVGFAVVQSIALAAAAWLARASGLANVNIAELTTRADTPPVLLVLAAADLATAVVVVFAAWVGTRSFAMLALARSGAARSFLYTIPLLALGVGPPVVAVIAGDHRMIATNVDAHLAETIVLLAVAVAVVEEVVFRGALMSLIGVKEHPWLAIWVSAVFFSTLHAAGPGSTQSVLLNLVQVAGIVAIPFACIRVVTGSVVGLIVTHALIDCVSLLQLGGFHLPAPPSRGEVAAQVAMSVVAALGYLVWAVLRLRRASGVLTR